MLVGQTVDSLRVFDIAQFMTSIGSRASGREIKVESEGAQAVNTLYASLFSEHIKYISLKKLPASHDMPEAPDYFGIGRVLDIGGALEVARTRASINTEFPKP